MLISPKHPKANGEAEAAVKIVKSLWRKNDDKHKALLVYRATPIPSIDLSPSQLSMGRRLRTNLPMARSLLEPEAHNRNDIRRRLRHVKEKQTHYYNRNGTKELVPLKPGEHVRIRPEPGTKLWRQATVVDHHSSPRSYIVDVGNQRLRRNRVALRLDARESTVEPEDKKEHPASEDVNQRRPRDDPNTSSTTQADQPPGKTTSSTVDGKQAEVADNTESQKKHNITRSGRISRKPAKLNI